MGEPTDAYGTPSLGFGYRATREWQRSSELLIERDTEESADLLVTAVTRDMRGARVHLLFHQGSTPRPADRPGRSLC